jgi:hypothetical protein
LTIVPGGFGKDRTISTSSAPVLPPGDLAGLRDVAVGEEGLNIFHSCEAVVW